MVSNLTILKKIAEQKRVKKTSKKLNLALSGSYKSNDLATCVRKSINSTANVGVPPVKTKYNTRYVTNSGFKCSEVEALLCMPKQRVMSLCQDSHNKHKATVISSFAQDGGVSSSSHASIALDDGRSYADAVKGCASGKTYLFNTHSRPRCGSNIDKHSEPNTEPRIVNTAYDQSKNAVHAETSVTARDNDNMKVFDINGLDDKYFSSILIKSCYEGKSVPPCKCNNT